MRMMLAAAPLLVAMAAGSGPAPPGGSAGPDVAFVDEAAEAGIVLANVSGSAEKRFIVETTGAGGCWLDYDLDGDLDLYVVNGAALEGEATTTPPARDALYRNEGAGRFTDATARAGIVDRGWGGGCAVGDYDNDGDPDLYVTNYGPNVLYRNEGHGIFTDVTAAAGVGDSRWSLGAAFFDAEGDGDLDLYVANYLRFDLAVAGARQCHWKGIPVMCGPHGFAGEEDELFRNNGDGTFSDVSDQAGIAGRALFGMGVVVGDVDGNTHPDVFAANDSQDNHLFLNDGWGRFQDSALAAGVALSADGRQQASMGADLGDYDNDGDEDLIVTNFSDDYHTLYRNDGGGLFTDATQATGLDPATRSSLGWGAGFFDYDNDGDLDLFIASGHVYPQVDGRDPSTSYRQQNLLFRNEGDGRFIDVSNRSGPGLRKVRSSRGAAFGDYDDDGDLDVFVVNENDVPSLLRNDGGNARHWLKVRVIGSRSNRDGIGGWVTVQADGRTQARQVRLSAGYLSSHDPRLHFGLGDRALVDRLDVRWPSGARQQLTNVPADRLVTISEERGLLSAVPLRGPAQPRAQPAPAGLADGAQAPSRVRLEAGAVPRASGDRISAAGLREVDALVQSGTRRLMGGEYNEGLLAYARALILLPSWEAAAQSPDALGFGSPNRYCRFLAALYDNFGVGLMRAERLDGCAIAIRRALDLVPQRTKFHHNLGLCHFHGRRYPEAVVALRAARAAGEAGPVLGYNLGRALALAGRCEEAITELTAAVGALPRPDRQGRDTEAWYHLGSCLADQSRPQEAIDAFREALALAPGHQKSLYRLGAALRRMGRTAAADQVGTLFQARQPADEAIRSVSLAGVRGLEQRLRSARLHVAAGLPGQALVDLDMVLAAQPAHEAALKLLGQASLALRPPDLGRAESALRKVLHDNARDVEALVGLGEVQRRRSLLTEAEAHFREALLAQPEYTAAAIGLARVAWAAGRAGEAVAGLEAVVADARHAAEPEALRALAEVHASETPGKPARPDEALRLLDRARSLYGEDVELRVRAHLARGDRDAASRVIEESPFLGRAQRSALLARLPGA
jgi:tetratricopeptide (TPR) repeat protein